MARERTPRTQRQRLPAEEVELQEDTGAQTSPAARPIEWDPNATPHPARVRSPSATPNPFRVAIPDELVAAKEQLFEELGGSTDLIRAQSAGRHGDRVGLENVRGMYIGRKIVDGRPTGRLAVKVQVATKISAPSQIDSAAQIPPVVRVGSREFPTDVEAVGRIVALADFQEQESPCRTGSTIGHEDGPTGTYGALIILEDGGNGKLCILSNNHVIAGVNGPPNARIIHPGLADALGVEPIGVGRFIHTIPLVLGGVSTIDAAAAHTTRQRVAGEHHTFSLDPEPLEATLWMTVKKEGRTTGLTEGWIEGTHGSISVEYERLDHTRAVSMFHNQLVIEGFNQVFSRKGDSGALVVHLTTDQPVALLFAGNEVNRSYANPIFQVMDDLGIREFLSA